MEHDPNKLYEYFPLSQFRHLLIFEIPRAKYAESLTFHHSSYRNSFMENMSIFNNVCQINSPMFQSRTYQESAPKQTLVSSYCHFIEMFKDILHEFSEDIIKHMVSTLTNNSV